MDRIVARVERHPHIFDWDRHSLGLAVVALVAEEILRAMDQQTSPDGQHWAPLSEAYDEWKQRHFPGQPMAVLTGHMKTHDQLVGLVRVTAREIGQTYGTDETARMLAVWFQEGNSRQPPRPFYTFGDVVVGRLNEFLDRHFAASI